MGKKRQNEMSQLKRRERRAEKNELKQKGAEATAMLAITQLQLRSTEDKLQEQTEKAMSSKAELAIAERDLQERRQEATSVNAKLQEKSQEARWAISMGNYYRSVLEEKKQDTLTSEKHCMTQYMLFQACAETTHASIDS